MPAHAMNTALRNFFTEKGIKLTEVAKLWNIQPSSISKKLDSSHSPTLDEFNLLVSRFGEEIIYVLIEVYPSLKSFFDEKTQRINMLENELNQLSELIDQTAKVKSEQDKMIQIMAKQLSDRLKTF